MADETVEAKLARIDELRKKVQRLTGNKQPASSAKIEPRRVGESVAEILARTGKGSELYDRVHQELRSVNRKSRSKRKRE